MAEPISYFNGDFVPDSECRIHISDRAFRRGDTIYDVSRTFGGRVHRLGEHIDRLYRSLKYARIDPGMSQEDMEEVTHEVIRRNPPQDGGDSMVWHTLVRGYAPSPARINTPAPATLCIQVKPIEFREFAHQYNDGVPVIFPRTRSYSANSLEPKLKHYSRMNFSMAELEATDLDPEAQAVLLDLDGNISENTSGNFFIVTDGVIRTPTDRSILQGVSRLDIFDLAKGLGIPVSEEDLQPYDAYTADEAFLTNTIYCALPVSRIDNRSLGSEVPGPVVQRILAAWSEMAGVDIVDQALHQAGSKA